MCPRLASKVAASLLRIHADDAEEELLVVALSRVMFSLEIIRHLDQLVGRFALLGAYSGASDEKVDVKLLPIATPSGFYFHKSQQINITTAQSRVLNVYIRSRTIGHPTMHRNSAVETYCSCAFANST